MNQYNALSIVYIQKEEVPTHFWEFYKRKFPKMFQFLEKREGWHNEHRFSKAKPLTANPFVKIKFMDGSSIYHYSDNIDELNKVEDYIYKCIVHSRLGKKSHGMFKHENGKVITWEGKNDIINSDMVVNK